MTTENKAASNSKIQMRKILVPIDGSECSLNAAKYAVKVAKDENAELFCIHVIASVPYGYASSPTATDQYFKDIEEKVQSWFDKVWTKKILDGKCSKWRCTACSLFCVTCQIATHVMFDGLAHGLPRVTLVLGFFREFSSQGIL